MKVNRDFEDLGGTDPYGLLGVAPDATAADIKRAHRRLVATAHTDRGGDEEQVKRINLARDVLLDPDRRKELDRRLRERRSTDHETPREAPKSQPRAAPRENRYKWEYDTGPSTGPVEPEPEPEPEPQAAQRENPYDWNYGTGPSTDQRRERAEPPPTHPWSARTGPIHQERHVYRKRQVYQKGQMYQEEQEYQETIYSTQSTTAYPGPTSPWPTSWASALSRYRSWSRRYRWTQLAIASLVLSLGYSPAGLLVAVFALVQIRRKKKPGTVIAWIAVGWAVLVLCVAVTHGDLA